MTSFEFRWNPLKSERLKKVRGATFEEVLASELIHVLENPNYPDQTMLFFWFREYVWVVPCVVKEGHIFLKTLYPSRKYTKIYQEGGLTDEKN